MRRAARTALAIALAGLFVANVADVRATEKVLSDSDTARLVQVAGAGRTQLCRLEIRPVAISSGPDAPSLVFATELLKRGTRTERLIQTVEPIAGAEATEIVIGDRRTIAPEPKAFSLSDQEPPAAFAALLGSRPVHVTTRMADGTVRSARFDGAPLVTALGALHDDCGVETTRLEAVEDLFAARERALALSPQDLKRYIWVLHAQYPRDLTPPVVKSGPTDATRRLLERFTREQGLAPSRYFSRDVLSKLGKAPFKPTPWDHRRNPGFRRYGDWYVYTEGKGRTRRCLLESEATGATGAMIWQYPHMRFWALANEGDATLRYDILTPNPVRLAGRAANVNVDGQLWAMANLDDAVVPVETDGSLSWKFVQAVLKGSGMTVTGPEAETGAPLTLDFSARGFTAGLKWIMKTCNRPDLKAWL